MDLPASRGRHSVFVSYSHRDREWLDRLKVHLRPLERDNALVVWDDTKIAPGSRWRTEIEAALAEAKVAVLLISADFLASDFVASSEIPSLLLAARNDGAVILPLIVSASRFAHTPMLAPFQAVNETSRPLIGLSRSEQEEILVHLTEAIERAVGNCQTLVTDATQDQRVNEIPFPDAEITGREPELTIEKINNFDAQRKQIDEAISLYEDRIPREERYDREFMVDLVRRHLSDEFGPTWKMHFHVATYCGRCVGMLICYEDLRRDFAFIAYLAARNPRAPGKNPLDVSKQLGEALMEGRRRLGLKKPPRVLFEVDDPALAKDRNERHHRLGRLKVFDRLAPFEAMHFRALGLAYIQPALEPPWTDSNKQLLLCYAAPGLHETLPKSIAIEILTWIYTELYGDDIIEEPVTRAAYRKRIRDLLDSVVHELPEQVRLLRYREIEEQ